MKVLLILSLICTERFFWIFILMVKSLLLVFITAWGWAILSTKKTPNRPPKGARPLAGHSQPSSEYLLCLVPVANSNQELYFFLTICFWNLKSWKQCDAFAAVLVPKEFSVQNLEINKDGRENSECYLQPSELCFSPRTTESSHSCHSVVLVCPSDLLRSQSRSLVGEGQGLSPFSLCSCRRCHLSLLGKSAFGQKKWWVEPVTRTLASSLFLNTKHVKVHLK